MTFSTIKPKYGICELCGRSGILTKKQCQSCYWLNIRLKSAHKSKAPEIEPDLQDLINEADIVFSKYVRKSAADENGLVKCYTCDNVGRWQDVDAGHFIGRSCIYLRHDLRNVKPQCGVCNRFKKGNLFEYAKNLEKEKPGIVEILTEESRIVYKPSRAELIAIIDEYQKVK